MLRTALRTQIQCASRPRTFVSTVLLTRSWENESVAILKKEARTRGLSQKGSKSTLITRLQQYEQTHLEAPPSPSPAVLAQQVRYASTTEIPGVPSSSEAPPLPESYPKDFLEIKIPDTYEPVVEFPVQIPFVPDFWDSSRVKAESAPPEPTEYPSPTVISVAGDASYISSSPSHTLYDSEIEVEKPSQPSNQTFLQDIAEDLFLPTSLKLPETPKQSVENIPQMTYTTGAQEKDYSRTLDKDEVRGVWALVGILAGSWLVAGFLSKSSAFAEKAEEVAEKVEEKVAGKH